MNLEKLVQSLAAASAWPVRVGAVTTELLHLDVEPPQHYVIPGVETVTASPDARVLLIEAAGAVGKSMAAEYCSARLAWPLVNTARAQVGSYTLSGLIQDALGMSSTFFTDLSKGGAGIVIDALDEAHLRSGTQNLFAFLDNVISLANSIQAEGVQIILLSRIDTAEYIKLKFAEEECALSVASLSFFGQESAIDYVSKYLAKRAEETSEPAYRVAVANPQPFKKLLQVRLAQIARTLLGAPGADYWGHWDDVKEFLGYAPVLTALAESLAVRNPGAELSRLKGMEFQDETSLLIDIVSRITIREQDKVIAQLSDLLRANLPADVKSGIEEALLYGHHEQLARLAEFVDGGDGLGVELPASLPPEVRDAYEGAVRQFLPDHPFLRGRAYASPVFSDIVRAVHDTDLTSQAVARKSSSTKVGPFYRRFVCTLVDEVPERIVADLLWSWGQESELYGEQSSASAAFGGNRGDVQFMVPSATSIDYISLSVVECSGVLELDYIPKRFTLTTSDAVVLGGSEGRFSIPPFSILIGSEIALSGHTLEVNSYEDQGFSLVYAQQGLSADELRQVQGGGAGFKVIAPAVPPVLRGYAMKLPEVTHAFEDGRSLMEDFVDLRAILLKFYSSVHLGLSCSLERMDRDVVRGSESRQRLLDFMMANNILSINADWLVMDPNALPFGMAEIRAGNPSPSVFGFLTNARHA